MACRSVRAYTSYLRTSNAQRIQPASSSLAPTEPPESEIDAMMVDIPTASDGTQKINWIMFLTMFADKMEGAPLGSASCEVSIIIFSKRAVAVLG